jgi:hypothetical protein
VLSFVPIQVTELDKKKVICGPYIESTQKKEMRRSYFKGKKDTRQKTEEKATVRSGIFNALMIKGIAPEPK